MSESSYQLTASVIVPVRNGRHFLRRLLPALESQTLPRERFEVIIADDGSTDGLIDGIAAESDWLFISRGEARNSFAARNRGAALARGSLLVFTDADCVPEPDWLEKGIKATADSDVVAGGVKFILPEKRTIWTLLDVELTKNQKRAVERGNAETANLFVRRELFDDLDGFETTTNHHGDYDFSNRVVRAGARLTFGPDAVVLHPTRNTARPVLQFLWEANHSYGYRMGLRHQRADAISVSHWLPIVRILGPFRRPGRHVTFDRAWFEYNGIQPTLTERLVATAIIHGLLPPMTGVAQLIGWIAGRVRASSPQTARLTPGRSPDATTSDYSQK